MDSICCQSGGLRQHLKDSEAFQALHAFTHRVSEPNLQGCI